MDEIEVDPIENDDESLVNWFLLMCCACCIINLCFCLAWMIILVGFLDDNVIDDDP